MRACAGIPRAFSHSVYCKCVYKWAEKDSYRTADVKDCGDPDFDFKKRFAFSKMNQGLVDYFLSDNVITFEVPPPHPRREVIFPRCLSPCPPAARRPCDLCVEIVHAVSPCSRIFLLLGHSGRAMDVKCLPAFHSVP